MPSLEHRNWVPEHCEARVQQIAKETHASNPDDIAAKIEKLAQQNRVIHEQDCFNLNPATNVMNPRAEAILSQGLGSRPSLGYPGDKYEMGLEAIEEIEVICAELCAEVFNAKYAEFRVPSGAISNLYGFMALCKPGDSIVVPPASVGGHVTHHEPGCAGLYGLDVHYAPVLEDGYSVDVDRLRELAQSVKPTLITIGGSLNLTPHPVSDIREIANEVGAKVLFDAAHQCGIIAGKAWPNPLDEGAHLMTMSTYKSLAGPAGGLIVTNDAEIAERLDQIAFPGMTANFDVAKSAALAITMADWKALGSDYATAMVEFSRGLAEALASKDLPVFKSAGEHTHSHQFAIKAAPYGGGQAISKKLRQSGFLACGIGLPIEVVEGDMNGLRIGTPELVRWGMGSGDIDPLAELISRAFTTNDPASLATEVSAYRRKFDQIHFVLD